jgi:hypothetical protein
MMFAIAPSALAAYLWPLPYGNELSSIFGDWRTRHYHAGLDLRTGGGIGLPVVAPADGYVMRLSTSYFGYGKALYFKMADGNVAVFGHLDHFRSEVEDYVENKQIEEESYNQNLLPEADRFAYHRGDTICFSGSTGVGAPHLHFEIRTADNAPLNPLAFDGLKMADTQPPEFRRLRIIGTGNDELAEALGRKLEYSFTGQRGARKYTLSEKLPSDIQDYWLAAEVVDRVGVNQWEKPIYSIELRQGEKVFYRLVYDSISFEHTSMIDAERNYRTAMRGASDFYNLVSSDQVLQQMTLGREVNIAAPLEIVARDIAGNETKGTINFGRQRWSARPDYQKLDILLQKYGSRYDDLKAAFLPAGDKLYLLVKQSPSTQGCPWVTSATRAIPSSEALQSLGKGYCLGIVDTVGDTLYLSENGKPTHKPTMLVTDYRRPWLDGEKLPGKLTSADGKFTVSFPPAESTLFPLERSYYFRVGVTKVGLSTNYTVSPSNLPLAKQVTYSYSLGGRNWRGVGLYFVSGRDASFIDADIDSANRAVTAKDYRLGTVSMRVDTIPPTITQVSPRKNAEVTSSRPTIKCRIADNLSGIRDAVEIRIDGKWCIPIYDPESGWLTAKPHFDLSKGKHRVEIAVTDRVGNRGNHRGDFVVGPSKRIKK